MNNKKNDYEIMKTAGEKHPKNTESGIDYMFMTIII